MLSPDFYHDEVVAVRALVHSICITRVSLKEGRSPNRRETTFALFVSRLSTGIDENGLRKILRRNATGLPAGCR